MEDPVLNYRNYSWVELQDARPKVRMFAGLDPENPTGWSFMAFDGKRRIATQWADSETDAIQKAEAWAVGALGLNQDKPLEWNKVRGE